MAEVIRGNPFGAGMSKPTDEEIAVALSGVTDVANVADALVAAGLVRETVPNGALTINDVPLTVGGAYLTIGV